MDITMTKDEHKARTEIIQIDIVVCYGQHDHDVCGLTSVRGKQI
jgi:hypothetical protein